MTQQQFVLVCHTTAKYLDGAAGIVNGVTGSAPDTVWT